MMLPLHLRVLAPPRIIHWIDSKAMFGDPLTHRDNLENQLQGYVNRFGPGLVIYWFGYVEEIRDWTPADIMIASKLPDEWVFPGDNSSSSLLPTPSALPASSPGASGSAAEGDSALPRASGKAIVIRTPKEEEREEAFVLTTTDGAGSQETLEVAPLGGLSPATVYRLYSSCGLLHLLPLKGGQKLGKERAAALITPP
jgi:Protein of unknown function TPD sequence-motif